MDGAFETVVFSDLYSATSEILVEDALVVIAGRVNYRDGEPKIIAEEVVPFEEAEEKFARSCHVNAMAAGIEEATLERLADVVSKNEGRCRLFIHCKASGSGEVIIESSVGRGLSPTPRSREQIEALIGEGTVLFSSRSEPAPAFS
jgi:DNA polymerase-3 subunit alpha